MRKGFLIYEEMRKYLLIYEEAVIHIWLCNCSILNFLIYDENFILFFISAYLLSPQMCGICGPYTFVVLIPFSVIISFEGLPIDTEQLLAVTTIICIFCRLPIFYRLECQSPCLYRWATQTLLHCWAWFDKCRRELYFSYSSQLWLRAVVGRDTYSIKI